MHFTLSFPCHALPSVPHSFLLFFHLLLNIHWFAIQRTERGSWCHLPSSFHCFFFSVFSTFLFSKEKKKCYNDPSIDNPISHLTVGTLGLPKPEACVTAKFCLGTRCLRDHAGGDQMGVFNTFGSHATLVHVLGPVLPNSS